MSYSGEIKEMAEHFSYYPVLYFALFLAICILVSLTWLFFFASSAKLGWLSLLGIVLLGALLRLGLLLTSQRMVGSEEAIMGLMARRMLFGGESYVFLWGQPYMGSLEAIFALPIFFLFGASSISLKMVPFFFSLLFIISIFILAKLVFDQKVALLSALLVAISPVFLTVFSMLANAYIENLFYGTVILILAYAIVHKIKDERQQLIYYSILGFLMGLAFWNNLTSIVYITTAIFFLLFKDRFFLSGRKIFPLVSFFLLGSLPLFIFNLRHSWITFKFILAGAASEIGWREKLGEVISNALKFFGIIRPIIGLGQTVWWLDALVYALFAISFIYVVASYRKKKDEKDPSILIIYFGFLFLFFVSTKYGALNEARYVLGLYSVLQIFLAIFLRRLESYSRVLMIFCLSIV